jgi:hypothetical protein
MSLTTKRTTLVTPRDLEILEALDRSPLTARQLLKLSRIFQSPFQSERKVRARMHRLQGAGRVRSWPYLIAGRGSPNYYTLARFGYQVLNGPDAASAKRSFGPVGIARQQHTLLLSEFIVHTIVSAREAGLELTDFRRENAVCLTVGSDSLYPDCTFRLATREGRELSFFVELDNCSERVRSAETSADSWERKLRLYEDYRDQSQKRFRVLVLTTGSRRRLDGLLNAARDLARNTHRSLLLGAVLQEYLHLRSALTEPCFLDHLGRHVAPVPVTWQQHRDTRRGGLASEDQWERAYAKGPAEAPRLTDEVASLHPLPSPHITSTRGLSGRGL